MMHHAVMLMPKPREKNLLGCDDTAKLCYCWADTFCVGMTAFIALPISYSTSQPFLYFY